MSNFVHTCSDGRIGESYVARYFKANQWDVRDVTGIQEYRGKDVDLIVTNRDGKSFKIEVKTDTRMHETGNIAVEKKMLRTKGARDGWLYTCKADYICYLSAATGAAYFLEWPTLQQAVFDGKGKEHPFPNWRDGCMGVLQLLSIEKDIRPSAFLKGTAQIVPLSELNLFHSLFHDPKIRNLTLAA